MSSAKLIVDCVPTEEKRNGFVWAAIGDGLHDCFPAPLVWVIGQRVHTDAKRGITGYGQGQCQGPRSYGWSLAELVRGAFFC